MRFSLILLALLLVGMVLVGPAGAYNSTIYTLNQHDGGVYNSTHNATMDLLRTSPGTGGDYGTAINGKVVSDLETDTYYQVIRGIVFFDYANASFSENPIPADATITKVILSLYPTATTNQLGTTTINIVDFTVAGAIDKADYDNGGTLLYADPVLTTDIPTSQRFNFTLNQNATANISLTPGTYTGYMILSGFDYYGTSPTWASGGSKASGVTFSVSDGLSAKPLVEVTWFNATPTADFTCTPVTGTTSASVSCTDASTQGETYNWSRSQDGVNYEIFSQEQSPVATFPTGVWDIRLTITNPLGTDTKTAYDYVDIRPSGAYTVKNIDGVLKGEDPDGTLLVSDTAGVDDESVIEGLFANTTSGDTVAFDGFINATEQIDLTGKNLELTVYNTSVRNTTVFRWDELSEEPLFDLRGTVNTTSVALTADVPRGTTVIHSSDDTVTTDMSLVIYDDGIYNANNSPSLNRGEIHKVLSVSGLDITLADPVVRDYELSKNVRIRKMTPISVNVYGFNITSTKPATDDQIGIRYFYGKDSTIENVAINNMGEAAIAFYSSIGMTVDLSTIAHSEMTGLGYGVSASDGSANILVNGSDISNCRHTVTTGSTGTRPGQVRNFTVQNSNLTGYTRYGGDMSYVVDAHAQTISYNVLNNNITHPGITDPYIDGQIRTVALGAEDVVIRDNNFFTDGTSVIAYRAPTVFHYNWVIDGNTFYTRNTSYGFNSTSTSSMSWDYLYYHNNTDVNLSGTYTGLQFRHDFPPFTMLDTDELVPIAGFSGTQSIPSVGKKSVSLTPATSFIKIDSYVWDATEIGNGTAVNQSTAANPTLTFGAGNYSIALTVSNEAGSNTTTTAYWVNVSASDSSSVPIAAFSANATTVCYGATVAFTDQSTNTSSWAWVFGDGATSTTQNPEHTYNISSGYFTVALTASNGIGSDTEMKTNYIEVQASCSGGDTTPSTHPFSAATGSSMITTALGILGLALIGFGAAIVIGAFTTQSTDGLIAGIFTIMLGGAILIISYMFLSPIMNLVA